ncbi:hypothetical protein IKQ21_05495 [bacterium]|nr:hypothetical protein [bacterium]
MDIFIIETAGADNIEEKILLEFKKREIANSKKLKEHCFSYLMMDRILEHVYKISNRTIIFENEKPILQSREKHITISHSGNYAIFGISDYNCGIDIEEMTERNFSKIAKRMNFNADTKEEFYKEWTLYEARYKLGEEEKKEHTLMMENYCISACSSNKKENFEVYILTTKKFSNV